MLTKRRSFMYTFPFQDIYIASCICFLLIRFIDKSSLNERNKRLFNYIVLSLLIIITILIFQWHSDTYLNKVM